MWNPNAASITVEKVAATAVMVQNHEPWEAPVGDNGTDVFYFNHDGYVPRAVEYEELEELSQLEWLRTIRLMRPS
jgi:hypothetical protein